MSSRLEQKPMMRGDLVDTLRDIAESAYERYLPAIEGELLCDRICSNCGGPQSEHIAARFCQPKRLKSAHTKLLEFRARATDYACSSCDGSGQIGREGSGDSDMCPECKGKGVRG